MTGSDTTPGAVNPAPFPPPINPLSTGPVARLVQVEVGPEFKSDNIKAIWNNEIGDAA